MSRNTHDRALWHRGTLGASRVAVGDTDLQTYLEELWARSGEIVVPEPPVPDLGFLADAVIHRAYSGSFIGDAIIRHTSTQNWLLDAVVRASATSGFPLDAELIPLQGWLMDAILQRELTGSFTADGILRLERAGSFLMDAELAELLLGFTVNSIIKNIATVRPTSDVAHSGTITRSSGTTTWNLIDETPNSNTDYVTCGSAAAHFMVQGPDPGLSGRTIQRVVLQWRGTNTAPAGGFRTGIRNPGTGTVYNSSTSLGVGIAQGVTTATHTWPVRPWDNAAWTDTDVAQLQFGGVMGPSGPYNNRTGSIWAEIHYY